MPSLPADASDLSPAWLSEVLDTAVVDTNRYPEVDKFLDYPYEHVVSEYERHVLGQDDIAALVPRPEYRAFKDAMRERMIRDDKLDAFLAEKLKE